MTRHVLAINGTTLVGCALNAVIAVPVLRCFALFSSLLVLVHVLVALSWLPAVLVLHFRYLAPLAPEQRPGASAAAVCRSLAARFDDIASLLEASTLRYLVILPIRYLRYALVFVMLASFAFALYYVLARSDRYLAPLSSNSTIAQLKEAARNVRLFADSHPLERFDATVAYFAFDKLRRASEPDKMPLALVFGFVADDPRSPIDPEAAPRGPDLLVRDAAFQPLALSTQRFLVDLCAQLKQFDLADSVRDSYALNDACFARSFRDKLAACTLTDSQCCVNGSRSLTADQYQHCMNEYQRFVATSSSANVLNRFDSGPRYVHQLSDRWNSTNIVGYLVQLGTNCTLAHSVSDLEHFRQRVTDWFDTVRQQHPEVALANAFFASAFSEYDLFRALHDGLAYATLAAAVCILLVSLLATRNVLLTLLAALTVAISCTVTGLFLTAAGWTLGVAESVCVTLLIGLSVDYALHCALTLSDAMRLQETQVAVSHTLIKTDKQHAMLVQYSQTEEVKTLVSDEQLQQSLKPLLYAALSSLVVALPLLVSDVALFRQTSAFISSLVAVSWCIATLFLTSCLKICEKVFLRSTMRC